MSVSGTVLTGGIHAVEKSSETNGPLFRVSGPKDFELILRSVVSQILDDCSCFTGLKMLRHSVIHNFGTLVVSIQRIFDVRVQAGHNHTHVIGRIHVTLGDDRLDVAPGGVEAQQLARNAIAFLPSLRIV